jgi:hypothetical protein
MLSHKHPDDYEYVPATLADMAEQLLADVRTLRRDDESASYRSTFDRLLLTTHQRVRDTAARKRSWALVEVSGHSARPFPRVAGRATPCLIARLRKQFIKAAIDRSVEKGCRR